jgi:glycosyltransferase involved in cell wall biosynthesis
MAKTRPPKVVLSSYSCGGGRAFMNLKTILIVTSRKTVKELDRHYRRCDPMQVLYPGIDHSVFNTVMRTSLRGPARKELELAPGQFAVILVGNDWRNKGVVVLLEALERWRDLPIALLIDDVSEIITDGVDGVILRHPRDAAGLAAMIRRLYADEPFRTHLGEKGAETAQQYAWERNGRELTAIFEEILRRKSGFVAQTLTQEL